MRQLLMMFTTVVSLTLLVGCQTTDTSGSDVCAVWRGIGWGIADTPETIDGVKGNNARRKAWCGGR